jgi:aminomethyltransferase
MEQAAQRTRLYQEHLALGGRMVSFAGWELPVQYDSTGPTVEHRIVREAVGLFDIDHMGQVIVSGPDAEAFLNYIQPFDIRKIDTWAAQYSVLPYADGGLVDDIFLYRQPDCWWVIINASNRLKDVAWMKAHSAGFAVTIEDISDNTYMLAIQGPKAQAVLQRLCSIDLAGVPFHSCAWADVAGVRTLIGATGYTGEYGYELFFPADDAVAMWRRILEEGKPEGILPCGLAARDSLRFEPCLPLYGHELSPELNPLGAGLGVFVDFGKGDFVGRDALLKVKLEGPEYKLVGFEMVDRGVARDHYHVLIDGKPGGWVTTGMKSPTSGRFVGMAYVLAAAAVPGTELQIVIRDEPKRAKVVKRPFYKPAYRR